MTNTLYYYSFTNYDTFCIAYILDFHCAFLFIGPHFVSIMMISKIQCMVSYLSHCSLRSKPSYSENLSCSRNAMWCQSKCFVLKQLEFLCCVCSLITLLLIVIYSPNELILYTGCSMKFLRP